jgi:hypothetical protein
MYECRHFYEDDCEQLPTSLRTKPELLVDAHEAYQHILSVKFPSFEHVGSPPPTDKFLDKTTVTIEPPGRNVSVSGADESWMGDLSAAEVLQQYGYDPNVILTSEGKLVLPDGGKRGANTFG